MPFELADSNINRNGRAPGSLNKATAISKETKQAIAELVHYHAGTLADDLASLPPELRIKYFIELAKFVLPQHKAINYQNLETMEAEAQDIFVTIVK